MATVGPSSSSDYLESNVVENLVMANSLAFESALEEPRSPAALKQAIVKVVISLGTHFKKDDWFFFAWVFGKLTQENKRKSPERIREFRLSLLLILKDMVEPSLVSRKTVCYEHVIKRFLTELQVFMDSMDSSEYIPRLLDLLHAVIQTYQEEFRLDVIDTLVGWFIDPSLPRNLAGLLLDSFRKFWVAWREHLKFGVQLVKQLFVDAQAAIGEVDPETVSRNASRVPPKGFAFIRCCIAVIHALSFASFPTMNPEAGLVLETNPNFVRELLQLTKKLLDYMLEIGKKFEDRAWVGQAIEAVRLFSRAMGPSFLSIQISGMNCLLCELSWCYDEKSKDQISDLTEVDRWLDVVEEMLRLWSPSLDMEICQTFSSVIRSPILSNLRLSCWADDNVLMHIKDVCKVSFEYFPKDFEFPGFSEAIFETFDLAMELNRRHKVRFQEAFETRVWMKSKRPETPEYSNHIEKLFQRNTSVLEAAFTFNALFLSEVAKLDINQLGQEIFEFLSDLFVPLNSESSKLYGQVWWYEASSRSALELFNIYKSQLSPTEEMLRTSLRIIGSMLFSSVTNYNKFLLGMRWLQVCIKECKHYSSLDTIVSHLDRLLLNIVVYENDSEIRLAIAILCKSLLTSGPDAYPFISRFCDTKKRFLISHFSHDSDYRVGKAFYEVLQLFPPFFGAAQVDSKHPYLIDVELFKAAIMSTPSLGIFKPRHFKLVMASLHLGAATFTKEDNLSLNEDWLRRLFLSSQVPKILRKMTSGGDDRCGDIYTSEELLTFWKLWEAARFCILSRLRTPFGGPVQLFDTIENALASLLQQVQVSSPAALKFTLRNLLVFIDMLELQVYQAADGSSILWPQTPKGPLVFFQANKKVCEDWFTRTRKAFLSGCAKVENVQDIEFRHLGESLRERLVALRTHAIKDPSIWCADIHNFLIRYASVAPEVKGIDLISGLNSWARSLKNEFEEEKDTEEAKKSSKETKTPVLLKKTLSSVDPEASTLWSTAWVGAVALISTENYEDAIANASLLLAKIGEVKNHEQHLAAIEVLYSNICLDNWKSVTGLTESVGGINASLTEQPNLFDFKWEGLAKSLELIDSSERRIVEASFHISRLKSFAQYILDAKSSDGRDLKQPLVRKIEIATDFLFGIKPDSHQAANSQMLQSLQFICSTFATLSMHNRDTTTLKDLSLKELVHLKRNFELEGLVGSQILHEVALSVVKEARKTRCFNLAYDLLSANLNIENAHTALQSKLAIVMYETNDFRQSFSVAKSLFDDWKISSTIQAKLLRLLVKIVDKDPNFLAELNDFVRSKSFTASPDWKPEKDISGNILFQAAQISCKAKYWFYYSDRQLQQLASTIAKLSTKATFVSGVDELFGSIDVRFEKQDIGELMRRLERVQKELKRLESIFPSEMFSAIRDTIARTFGLGASTPHENWFSSKFEDPIRRALEKLETLSKVENLKETVSSFLNTDLSKEMSNKVLLLKELSPFLSEQAASSLMLPLPSTSYGDEHLDIVGMDPQLHVLSTKTKPKKVTFKASDGRYYSFLLKGLEDLHLDERMQQIFEEHNRILRMKKHSRQAPPHFKTYSVVPFGDTFGMIEWVENGTQLFSLYKRWQLKNHTAKHLQRKEGDFHDAVPPPPRPHEVYYSKLSASLKRHKISRTVPRRRWPTAIFHEVHQQLVQETPKDLITRELWCNSTSSKFYFEKVQNYARSLAINSALGYSIGLGDRHLDNIMLDIRSGDVVHIDFNVCFEKGTRLRVPERVPFRLTQNMEYPLQVPGVYGLFRRTFESFINSARESKESIMTILEAFIFDPLAEWTQDVEESLKKLRSEFDLARELLYNRITRDRTLKLTEKVANISELPSGLNIKLQRRDQCLKQLIARLEEAQMWTERHRVALKFLINSNLPGQVFETLSSEPANIFPLLSPQVYPLSLPENIAMKCMEMDNEVFRISTDRKMILMKFQDNLFFYMTIVGPIVDGLMSQDYFGMWADSLRLFLDTQSVSAATGPLSDNSSFGSLVALERRLLTEADEARMEFEMALHRMEAISDDPLKAHLNEIHASNILKIGNWKRSKANFSQLLRCLGLYGLADLGQLLYLCVKDSDFSDTKLPSHINETYALAVRNSAISERDGGGRLLQFVSNTYFFGNSTLLWMQFVKGEVFVDDELMLHMDDLSTLLNHIHGFSDTIHDSFLPRLYSSIPHGGDLYEEFQRSIADLTSRSVAIVDMKLPESQNDAAELASDYRNLQSNGKSHLSGILKAFAEAFEPLFSFIRQSASHNEGAESEIILNALLVYQLKVLHALMQSRAEISATKGQGVKSSHWDIVFSDKEKHKALESEIVQYLELLTKETFLKPLLRLMGKVAKKLSQTLPKSDPTAETEHPPTGIPFVDTARKIVATVLKNDGKEKAELYRVKDASYKKLSLDIQLSLNEMARLRTQRLKMRADQRHISLVRFQYLHEQALSSIDRISEKLLPITLRIDSILMMSENAQNLKRLASRLSSIRDQSAALESEVLQVVSSETAEVEELRAASIVKHNILQAEEQKLLLGLADMLHDLVHFETFRIDHDQRHNIYQDLPGLMNEIASIKLDLDESQTVKEGVPKKLGEIKSEAAKLYDHMKHIMVELHPYVDSIYRAGKDLKEVSAQRSDLKNTIKSLHLAIKRLPSNFCHDLMAITSANYIRKDNLELEVANVPNDLTPDDVAQTLGMLSLADGERNADGNTRLDDNLEEQKASDLGDLEDAMSAEGAVSQELDEKLSKDNEVEARPDVNTLGDIGQMTLETALTALQTVEKKLSGINCETGVEFNSVEEQIDTLVRAATSANNLAVMYEATVDRGALYHRLRRMEGFKLAGFYHNYVFATFFDVPSATSAVQACTRLPGVVSAEFARQTYFVPYPQPDDADVEASASLHVTHLPQNYARSELVSVGLGFPGFESIKFFQKYCYLTFQDEASAKHAREILREETNLVVTYARVKRHFQPQKSADEPSLPAALTETTSDYIVGPNPGPGQEVSQLDAINEREPPGLENPSSQSTQSAQPDNSSEQGEDIISVLSSAGPVISRDVIARLFPTEEGLPISLFACMVIGECATASRKNHADLHEDIVRKHAQSLAYSRLNRGFY
ncbi:Serine/threonine-protein kinase smg1 [Phlyctochytrium planicorne]|nr:Serine/threonine-protein kinase smg1 [Phlyctochytrium planicorne]